MCSDERMCITITINIIKGRSLLATFIQSLLSLEYLIDLSAKIIDKIKIIIFTIDVATINFINEPKIWLNKELLVLKKKLTIIISILK